MNKVNLPIKVLNNTTPIPKIKFINRNLGEVYTETIINKDFPNRMITFLKDKYDRTLGLEEINLEQGLSTSAGLTIEAMQEFRNKGLGIGEMLRLTSIIAILENKIKEFFIYSKNTAIYFHSKYKFQPAIDTFSHRDFILENIIKNCKNKYENIKEDAQILLERAREEKKPESQRELCKETNELLKKYFNKIKENKDEQKSHPFDIGFRMVLTEDEIIKNKDFFNNLFKKYNVNYKI